MDEVNLNKDEIGYLISWDDTIDGKQYKSNEAIEKVLSDGMF